jgi:hypothetical protein
MVTWLRFPSAADMNAALAATPTDKTSSYALSAVCVSQSRAEVVMFDDSEGDASSGYAPPGTAGSSTVSGSEATLHPKVAGPPRRRCQNPGAGHHVRRSRSTTRSEGSTRPGVGLTCRGDR